MVKTWGYQAPPAEEKSMKIAIHQPEFLPYLGYFYKMTKVDGFVLMDSTQFKKNNFQNRNQICNSVGEKFWLTVPVSFHLGQNINEVKIADDSSWKRKITDSLKYNYSKTLYFKHFYPALEDTILNASDSLNDLNISLIKEICSFLGIGIPIFKLSELNLTTQKNELLIDICKHIGANEYLAGLGAKEYMDLKMFADADIEVTWSLFQVKEYPQQCKNFVPYLSAVDALFNLGPIATKELLIDAE